MYNLYRLFPAILMALATPFLCIAQQYWQPFPTPGSTAIGAMASNRPGEVFITNEGGIMYSSDNGLSWEHTTLNIPLSSVDDYFFAPGSDMYLRTLDDVLHYNAGINTWEEIPMPADLFNNNITVNPQNELIGLTYYGKVYRRKNEPGALFDLMATLSPSFSFGNWAAAFDESHNLAFNTNGKLYHFPTTGPATEVLALPPVTTTPHCLAFHPTTGVALFGYNDQLMRSVDKGLTWLPTNGLALNPNTEMRLSFGANGAIYLQASNKIWVSHDNAANWTEFNPGNQFATFAPTLDGTLFASQSCYQEAFLRSTDNGQTWMHLEDRFPYFSATILANSFGRLYIKSCNQSTPQVSTDGGKTYTPVWINGLDINQLKADDFGHLIAVASDNRLYKSLDGGQTWTDISPTNVNGTIALAADGNPLCVFFTDSVAVSKDLGASWSKHGSWFAGVPVSADVHPNGNIYAYYFNRIYRSTDDGVSFEQVFKNIDKSIAWMHMTRSGAVVFQKYLNGTTVLDVMMTEDEGASFHQIRNSNIYVKSIASTKNGALFLLEDNNITGSFNGGLSWQSLQTGPVYPTKVSNLYVDASGYLYTGAKRDIMYRSVEPVYNFKTISGKNWTDVDNDCVYAAGEPAASGWKVKAQGPASAFYTFCNSTGTYDLTVPAGVYSVNLLPPNALWQTCQNDVPADLGPNGGSTATADLGARAVSNCPYLSVSLGTPRLRRCFENTYTVQYCNQGTAMAENVQLTLEFDPAFDILSSSIPWTSQNGQILLFDLPALAPNACGSIQVRVKLSCDIALGGVLCTTATLSPAWPCSDGLPDLSTARDCRPSIGAYDPNDKQAFIGGREEGEWAPQDSFITYQIRFQNTGTDTAFRVVVADRLSSLLDVSTVQPLVASHPYRADIRNGNVLYFTFDNIMLPDSNVNEAASHGFVQFRVAQRAGNTPGTVIGNFADIYFDFNEPVRTNTVQLTVGAQPVSTQEPAPSVVRVYPNPFEEFVTFEASGSTGQLTLRLFDPLGRSVRTETFTAPVLRLARRGLPEGVYLYRIEQDSQVFASGKVLVR